MNLHGFKGTGHFSTHLFSLLSSSVLPCFSCPPLACASTCTTFGPDILTLMLFHLKKIKNL